MVCGLIPVLLATFVLLLNHNLFCSFPTLSLDLLMLFFLYPFIFISEYSINRKDWLSQQLSKGLPAQHKFILVGLCVVVITDIAFPFIQYNSYHTIVQEIIKVFVQMKYFLYLISYGVFCYVKTHKVF